MIDELSHMLKNEQSRHAMPLLKKKKKLTKKTVPLSSVASIPYDSSLSTSDDSAHNAAKTDKRACNNDVVDDKMSFNSTYNTFGSTNDTMIKCKSVSQF